MGKNAPSIVYDSISCAARSNKCDCVGRLEKHHIFYGTANRRLSDEDGLTCYLCEYHHRSSPNGIHGGNNELDMELKAAAQKAYMEAHSATIEDFIHRYGKNYL